MSEVADFIEESLVTTDGGEGEKYISKNCLPMGIEPLFTL